MRLLIRACLASASGKALPSRSAAPSADRRHCQKRAERSEPRPASTAGLWHTAQSLPLRRQPRVRRQGVVGVGSAPAKQKSQPVAFGPVVWIAIWVRLHCVKPDLAEIEAFQSREAQAGAQIHVGYRVATALPSEGIVARCGGAALGSCTDLSPRNVQKSGHIPAIGRPTPATCPEIRPLCPARDRATAPEGAQLAIDAGRLDQVLDLEPAALVEGDIFDTQGLDISQVGASSETAVEAHLAWGLAVQICPKSTDRWTNLTTQIACRSGNVHVLWAAPASSKSCSIRSHVGASAELPTVDTDGHGRPFSVAHPSGCLDLHAVSARFDDAHAVSPQASSFA